MNTLLVSLATGAAAALPAAALSVVFTRRYWRDVWRLRGIELPASWGQEAVFATFYALTVASLAGAQAAATVSALAWMLAFAARSDIVTGKIPKEPLWAAGCVAAIAAYPYSHLVAVLVLFAVMFAIVTILVLVTRGGLGSSDARLLLAATPAAFTFDLTASVLALGVAAILQLLFRVTRQVPPAGRGHAFAPALALGFLLTWMLSVTPLWQALGLGV